MSRAPISARGNGALDPCPHPWRNFAWRRNAALASLVANQRALAWPESELFDSHASSGSSRKTGKILFDYDGSVIQCRSPSICTGQPYSRYLAVSQRLQTSHGSPFQCPVWELASGTVRYCLHRSAYVAFKLNNKLNLPMPTIYKHVGGSLSAAREEGTCSWTLYSPVAKASSDSCPCQGQGD